MARKGGLRRKKRAAFTKPIRNKGKISFKRYLAEYNEGDNVYLTVEPAVSKGTFNPRFLGKKGTVVKKQGFCYQVNFKDGKSSKILVIHPSHLKKA